MDTLGWRRGLVSPSTWKSIAGSVGELRAERYDVAFDLQGLVKSSALVRLARAERRVGFGDRSREPVSRFLVSESYAPPAELHHVVRRNLYLLRALDIDVTDADVPLAVPERSSALRASLESEKIRRYALLNPGAGWVTKRWSARRFGELATAVAEMCDATPLVLWGPGERELAQEVVEASSGRARLAPATDLRDLVSLLSEAVVVVGGDTGPIHIAAGLGVPVVGLYGPSNPATHGPYGRRVATVWSRSSVPRATSGSVPGMTCNVSRRCRSMRSSRRCASCWEQKKSPPGGGGPATANG